MSHESIEVVPMHVIRPSIGMDDTAFFATELDLTHIPTKCHLILSGQPHANAGFIYDDHLLVNGHDCGNGFVLDDPSFNPGNHIGEPPMRVYKPREWLDITQWRASTHNRLRIALYDRGAFYCSSKIFLRFLSAQ